MPGEEPSTASIADIGSSPNSTLGYTLPALETIIALQEKLNLH